MKMKINKLTKKKNVSRTKSRKKVSKSIKNMRGGRGITFENKKKIFSPDTGSPKKPNLMIVPTVKTQPSWVKKPNTVEVKPRPIVNKLIINPLLFGTKTTITRPDISKQISQIIKKKNEKSTQQQTEALRRFVSKTSYVEPIGKIPEGLTNVPKELHTNIVGIVQRQLQKYPNLDYNALYRDIYNTRTYNPFKELTEKNEAQTPETKKNTTQSIYSILAKTNRENPYED